MSFTAFQFQLFIITYGTYCQLTLILKYIISHFFHNRRHFNSFTLVTKYSATVIKVCGIHIVEQFKRLHGFRISILIVASYWIVKPLSNLCVEFMDGLCKSYLRM